jgi:hypothetical protein
MPSAAQELTVELDRLIAKGWALLRGVAINSGQASREDFGKQLADFVGQRTRTFRLARSRRSQPRIELRL